jgi:hypothetical protein
MNRKVWSASELDNGAAPGGLEAASRHEADAAFDAAFQAAMAAAGGGEGGEPSCGAGAPPWWTRRA